MKNWRLFCAAAVLCLTFSIPASAGDVQTPTIPPPPPPPAANMSDSKAPVVSGDLTTVEDLSRALFDLFFGALSL